jgi:hypothetical protein
LINAAAQLGAVSGTGLSRKIHAAVAQSETPEASVKIRKTGALRSALYR